MDRIHIQQLRGPDQHNFEIVERKGIGHPDTICDLVMEQISLALCRAYSEQGIDRLYHRGTARRKGDCPFILGRKICASCENF